MLETLRDEPRAPRPLKALSRVEKNLNEKDEQMKIKTLLKTKTFWAGLASVGAGVGEIIAGSLSNGLQLVLAGISVIFIRDAISKTAK